MESVQLNDTKSFLNFNLARFLVDVLPSANLEETLRHILRHALTVFRADQGLLSLADGTGLKVAASQGFREEFLRLVEADPSGFGACAQCRQSGRSVTIPDAGADPRLKRHRAAIRAGGFQAVYSLPLVSREGAIVGVLSAFFAVSRQPTPEEAEFGEVYARLAAESIEQAELRRKVDTELKQRRLAEGKLREQAENLEILNRTGARLAEEHDLETILQAVTDGGRTLSKAAFGAFFYNTVDDKGESFSLYTLSGAPKESFAGFPMPRKTALFAPTFEGLGVLRYDDVTEAPEYGKSPPHHGMPAGHLDVRSYLAVPVVSRSGKVLGGLFYGHPEPGVFTAESERLLVNLASQASVAIDNSNLHAALQAELVLRKRREEEAQRFAAIVKTSSDAIISKDLNSIVTSWNRAAESIFGYSAAEMIGRPITLLIPENLQHEEVRILEAIRKGETLKHYETVRRRKDGTLIDISLTISPLMDEAGTIVGASKIARDITDRKQFEAALKSAEEQLRQSQKMEAVGRLAGGIAHDFNNLLTSITGFTDLALAELGEDAPVSDYLHEVRKSGDRAASLTQQLLAYSRKQVLAPKIINLNDVVADMDKMLRRLIGEDILIRSSLQADLSAIKADPSQVQQIIVNLVLNARDAMPSGGNLSLETADVQLDPGFAASHLDAAPGPHVMLAVRDTGTGMKPEVKSRIFEPFFTTKPVGKGTGLGLSSVYGIVKQSGGSISVETEEGRGSVFKIFFPAVEDAGTSTPEGPAARAPAVRSGETLLLAEDELTVRKFLATTLRLNGYTVIEAADGEEALAKAKAVPKIDLLLTDVLMPRMNGSRLAEELRTLHGDLKVLFISGYTKDILSAGDLASAGMGFLQKPFKPEELLAKVRELAGNSRVPRPRDP